MLSILKVGTLVVVTDAATNRELQFNCYDDELFKQICECNTCDEITELLGKEDENYKKLNAALHVFDNVEKSKILVKKGISVYWPSVSQLSLPPDLVTSILIAEKEDNYDALEAYRNFWTLMSLNPDSRCRENLFWFLNKWGMRISKSGLFVGYRNVDIYRNGKNYLYSQALCDYVKEMYETLRARHKNTSAIWVYYNGDDFDTVRQDTPEYQEVYDAGYTMYNLRDLYQEFKAVNFKAKNCGSVDTVYTDHYSHTFKIKIGEMVTLPREECDSNNDVSCSRGLHLGGKDWINAHYFGEQGLVCLCNPADVVSVPHVDDYGKLRTCAYLPIALAEYDKDGKVIEYNVEDGFDSKWIKTVLYDGIKSTEENPVYKIHVPDIPEINKSLITEEILQIAQSCINK